MPAWAARDVSSTDLQTLKNVWVVLPGFGSYHLRNGRYESPSGRFRISLFLHPGVIAVQANRAAVLSSVLERQPRPIVFLSLFTRVPGGFFRNDASVVIGRGSRPLAVTLHGPRIRVSVINPGGRQSTYIFHVRGQRLFAAATRHAQ